MKNIDRIVKGIFAVLLTTIAAGVLSPVAASVTPETPLSSEAGNVRVDFTSTIQTTSRLSVGSCISTYAGSGTNVIKGQQQSLWRQYLRDLGPMLWRIPLYYHAGQVGSAAGGVHAGNEGAAYIKAIKSIDGIPMIVVGGTTNDNDIQADDAADLVHYFNDGDGQNGGPVNYFVVGNEPDNDFGLGNYIFGGNGSSGFHANVTAMRAATTRRLYVAGPAFTTWADYKFDDFRTFFANANADVDIIDFHKYGDGQHYDNIDLTYEYSDAVNWLRAEIGNTFGSRAADIGIQLGEFNYNSSYSGWSDTFYTSRNLVHTASVIGHMLQQGGRAYQYSDNNGPLGLITDGTSNDDQPLGQYVRLPAYWGISVWTGGAWTRRFGSTMVSATTSLPDFEVYATDHAKKIILINKSSSADQTPTIDLVGKDNGTYSVWLYPRGMDPTAFTTGEQFHPPIRTTIDRHFRAGQIRVDVPWMSVVVVTVD